MSFQEQHLFFNTISASVEKMVQKMDLNQSCERCYTFIMSHHTNECRTHQPKMASLSVVGPFNKAESVFPKCISTNSLSNRCFAELHQNKTLVEKGKSFSGPLLHLRPD